MAVKVISDKPEKTKQCVCTKCGYRLEYTGEDVKVFTSRDYTGGSDSHQTIKCPRTGCGETNYVKWP